MEQFAEDMGLFVNVALLWLHGWWTDDHGPEHRVGGRLRMNGTWHAQHNRPNDSHETAQS